MENKLPVTQCQYCGSRDIGEGWQHGEALVTFRKRGLSGNRLRYLLCRQCGAILYQCVAEPQKYRVYRQRQGAVGVFCFQRHLVSVKCSGGLKVTRENERIPPYRT